MMEAHVSDHAPAESAETPASHADQAGVQLRILSGCHQGASLALVPGQSVSVGSDDDCDVWLSDCGLAAGESVQVMWQQAQWSVLSGVQQAQAGEQGAAMPSDHALGAVALLGQVSATVCKTHVPWQAFVPAAPQRQDRAAEAASPADADQPEPAADGTAAGTANTTTVAPDLQQIASPSRENGAKPAWHQQLRSRQVAACCLALLLLGAGWAVWRHAPASASVQEPARDLLPAQAVLSPQAREKAVQDATLAIALVDPALRMRVASNAEGGATVSGWVDSVEQLDRLAQALSSLRPLPRLAVRTAAEVLDALSDAGSVHSMNLQFSLLGSGKVQAKGMVATPSTQQLLLAQLRERAPEGIEIIDGLKVASLQGPAVKSWLAAQGLAATRAEWDGEQLVLGVDVSAGQRVQLERLLAAAQTPLSGVPFLLQTRSIQAEAVRKRVQAGDAGLPFRIRSVVGGAAPYVVLADGAKLQPGGGHAGWRLVAVEPDHVVFDGPKRLEINR